MISNIVFIVAVLVQYTVVVQTPNRPKARKPKLNQVVSLNARKEDAKDNVKESVPVSDSDSSKDNWKRETMETAPESVELKDIYEKTSCTCDKSMKIEVHFIDRIARFLFPMTYILFIILFICAFYIMESEHEHEN